ncbi:MAG: PD-(D/E)XK nuclease family protein [Candidatus Omnitrophica bacterium]|nr:PD-(D/E)XK nuclease family protein [Candidatus Omnitrophota bacterium]
MKRVITYSFGENIIDKIAGFLCENFLKEGKDLSRVACVFGGKRPSLFLRRELARRIKKSYLPPRSFSMDEFINYIVSRRDSVIPASELDSCYLLYTLAKEHIPGILSGRNDFAEFLPWAGEIKSFIEQLDLEDIENDSLKCVQKSAEIGYEIPENINRLLQEIIKLRNFYHQALKENNIYSRGLRYLKAGEFVREDNFEEFEAIVFCNFFYLQAAEQKIIGEIYRKGKGVCIFQGSEDRWPVFKETSKIFKVPISPDKENEPCYNLNLYRGFDIHSQVCLVREILKKIENKNNTVIVLPRTETVIPLLSEVSSCLEEFNVSMGYPLKRGPLYTLFDLLLKAQDSKREEGYYSRDYLNLLKHPLVKNLKLSINPAVTRVLAHKIEEIIQGSEESLISGSLFLSLSEIEDEEKIYSNTIQTLTNMGIDIKIDECRRVLNELHGFLFSEWQGISDFRSFSRKVSQFLNVLADRSMIWAFPFNMKAIEKLYGISEEMSNLYFSDEEFRPEEIRQIFQQQLLSEMVSFSGSPLRGTQILGLFETRSLNFENVIVMDMNESVLPKLKIYEPLIPREVMLNLGLNRLEKEEEIQRYQFMRLISAAKNVHLIYSENEISEKSRFIEELLWNRQKETGNLEVITIPRASFFLKSAPRKLSLEKTPEIIEFLKTQTYSASRINTYLNCPLQFYYKYVLGLKESEDLLEDPEATHIGIFIHDLLKETFEKFMSRKPVIDKKFRNYFFKVMDSKFNKEIKRRMKSDSFLLKGIIEKRLDKFLDAEEKRNVDKIICLEQELAGRMNLAGQDICFRYTVDRIDEFADKSIVIIDYKTGGVDYIPRKFTSLENMEMTRRAIKETIKSFQLPIYYHFVSKNFPDAEVNAQLYSVRTLERNAFISEVDLPRKKDIMKICLEALQTIFIEIFDPQIPFVPDKDERRCQYCPFKGGCL